MNVSKKTALLLAGVGLIVGTAGAIGIQVFAQQNTSNSNQPVVQDQIQTPAPQTAITGTQGTQSSDAANVNEAENGGQDKNEPADNGKEEVGQDANEKVNPADANDQSGTDNHQDSETNDAVGQ